MSLEDNFSNKIMETFPIKVLTSPCETSDTTYISPNQEGSVERSSSLVQKSYYRKEKSILEKSGYSEEKQPAQYIEITESNKTEIIDTVFLTSGEIKKYFPEISKILMQKNSSNKLTKQELKKLVRIQKKKAKKASKKKREKANITFNTSPPKTDFSEDVSFKKQPQGIPDKIDLYKVKNKI